MRKTRFDHTRMTNPIVWLPTTMSTTSHLCEGGWQNDAFAVIEASGTR
jgi:hypothetical protein